MPLVEAKAAHLSDPVPHDLGVCGEAPAEAAGPQLADLLTPVVTSWPVLRPRAMCSVAQSRACCGWILYIKIRCVSVTQTEAFG